MKRERQSGAEVKLEHIRAYTDTFISRADKYPIQLADGRYVTVKKKLSLQLVNAHLRGNITLGAYALSPESIAKWLCFDADTDEQWNALLSLATTLAHQDEPSYLEPSRRGGHLWMFFSQLLPGASARLFGKQLIDEYSLGDIELFPKQNKLKTGPGSLVRLPLGRHQMTGRRYHFVDLGGEPLAPTIREQVRILGHPQTLTQIFVDRVLAQAEEEKSLSPTPLPAPTSKDISGDTLSERIKSVISVYDFVGRYVPLDERGRGLCPFHDDEHASFSVDADKNYWHCFAGCGGGSIVDFLMKWRELRNQDADFVATLKDLADMLL